jgi:hypothetical protein
LLTDKIKGERDTAAATLLASDNYGNNFMMLAETSFEEKMQFVGREMKRLQDIGLGVARHPDCS